MANKIKLKRGAFANLPTLDIGEPAFTTDTHDLYLGSANGNVNVSHKSSPNLCDNPFFTVNRRGFTTMTSPSGNQYTADRWFFSESSGSTGAEATLTDNGMSLNNSNAASGTLYFQQSIPKLEVPVGKPITLSVLMGDGTIYSATRASMPARTASTQNIISSAVVEGLTLRLVYGSTTSTTETIQILVATGKTFLIRAVKLELGASSTLLYDDFPDYEQEVIKCATANVVATDYYAKGQYPLSSNPNLLDNGWFTINQRNATSGHYENAIYRMDRWYTSYSTSTAGNWDLTDGVLTMDMTNSTGANFFIQRIDPTVKPSIIGKVVTASLLMADDTIVSGTSYIGTGSSDTNIYNNGNGLLVGYSKTNGFMIRVNSGHSYSFKAAKLEVGNMSTLYLDVAPKPAEELAKCRYRYVPISLNQYSTGGFGFMKTATEADITIPLSSPIALDGNTPTLTVNNSANLKIIGGSNAVTPTAWAVRKRTSTTMTINFTIPSGYYTAGTMVMLTSTGDADINISADL